MTGIEDLIARSSLGTPEAVALQALVPNEVARRCVTRARELADCGGRHSVRTVYCSACGYSRFDPIGPIISGPRR